jgi:quercetin dioxygenase-like cupin family protein
MCQASHWGYVLKGRMRVRFKDREEVFEAGEVYYIEPGHVPFIEEDYEVVEFSPKAEYERTLAVVARNMAATDEGT